MKINTIVFGFGVLSGFVIGMGILLITGYTEKPPVYNYQLVIQRTDLPMVIAVPVADNQLEFFRPVGTNPPIVGKIGIEKIVLPTK